MDNKNRVPEIFDIFEDTCKKNLLKEAIRDSRIPIFDISQIDISKEKGKNFFGNTHLKNCYHRNI